MGKTVTSIKDRVGSNFVRYKKQSLLWRAIVKYGVDSIVTEVLYEAPVECLNTLEKLAICQNGSHKTRNGYNMTWGGDGIGSDDARASVLRQLEQGTHVFLDASFREKSKKINAEMGRRRFKEGVHPFQRPLVREKRRNNLRESTQKRLENGTHHFLSGEIQKKSTRRLLSEGKHIFQDAVFREKQNSVVSESARRRIQDGTHNFLSDGFYSRSSWKCRLTCKARRRDFYRLFSSLLTSRSVLLEYRYRHLQREGFFDKDIPDISGATQMSLFE